MTTTDGSAAVHLRELVGVDGDRWVWLAVRHDAAGEDGDAVEPRPRACTATTDGSNRVLDVRDGAPERTSPARPPAPIRTPHPRGRTAPTACRGATVPARPRVPGAQPPGTSSLVATLLLLVVSPAATVVVLGAVQRGTPSDTGAGLLLAGLATAVVTVLLVSRPRSR